MFDNLREQANASPFYEEEAQFQPAAGAVQSPQPSSGNLLGLSAVQRFILSVMFMLMVCLVGAMFLVVMGKFG